MKKLMIAFALAAASAFAADDDAQYGGQIKVWPKDPGLFLFVNAQSRVSGDPIEKPVAALAREFRIDIRKIAGGAGLDVRKVPEELKKLGAKGGIWIVDDPVLPVCLSATEDGWGVINVAPILADSPDAAKVEKRMLKYINRTFGNIHGVGDSLMMPGCVMKLAVGVAGVDALECPTFSPEAHGKISNWLLKSGYKSFKSGLYYDACEEGWAPAPTNAVQKQIWDKVHQMPTKPIKILPPSKR